MKKAVIITNIMPATNRSPLVTLSKFEALAADSFDEIHILGGNLEAMRGRDTVQQHNLPFRRGRSLPGKLLKMASFQWRAFWRSVRLIDRDCTVFFWIGDKMLLPFLAAKLRRASIHYFVYGNVAAEGVKTRFSVVSEKLIRFMARRADYLCAESPSVVTQWAIPNPPPLRIIHLFVEGIENEPDLSGKEPTVGMLCRLTQGKHVIESIEAFAALHKEFPTWRLDIVGSGKLYDACRQQIDELGASDYIALCGWVEHDQIYDRLSRWSLLLFPTDAEGLPNSVIEAMAAGTPALASPVGGLRDLIEDGKNGWILRATSPAEIADGLRAALRDDGRTDKAHAARDTILQRYTFERALASFQQLFPPVT